jgi:hypothetical protein
MAAAPSSHQRTECMSLKDVLAVAKKYGFRLKVAGDGMDHRRIVFFLQNLGSTKKETPAV